MGGLFAPTAPPPPQVVSPFPDELKPLISAIGNRIGGLFTQASPPGSDVLDQTVAPATGLLSQQLRGAFLPGQSQGNPFLSALDANFARGADVARRQLGSAAQRAGALTSTDYLRQASDLEANLAGQRGSIFANVFENERQRQLQSIPLLSNILGLSRAKFQYPFDLASGFLPGARGTVVQGQYGPSPFASLLSAAAPFFI